MANLSTNAAVNEIAALLGAAEEQSTNGALNLILAAIQDAEGGGGAPYKTLVCNFTQTGTSNPTLTIYENTLENSVAATRFGVGRYALINNDFVTGLVWIPLANRGGADGNIRIPVHYDGSVIAEMKVSYSNGANFLLLEVFNAGTDSYVEFSGLSLGSFDFPEIRVYTI